MVTLNMKKSSKLYLSTMRPKTVMQKTKKIHTRMPQNNQKMLWKILIKIQKTILLMKKMVKLVRRSQLNTKVNTCKHIIVMLLLVISYIKLVVNR